ncbi:hypothetical protein [uncultured Microbulbifer sp.]|uniref:hypothetical protein n=1 Tax=uncultured Microbulbifer sp. TaxID=348147 RepID=UPI00261E1CBA|nr:hypothetical protein [uncultured Microbulbifer sp.]
MQALIDSERDTRRECSGLSSLLIKVSRYGAVNVAAKVWWWVPVPTVDKRLAGVEGRLQTVEAALNASNATSPTTSVMIARARNPACCNHMGSMLSVLARLLNATCALHTQKELPQPFTAICPNQRGPLGKRFIHIGANSHVLGRPRPWIWTY